MLRFERRIISRRVCIVAVLRLRNHLIEVAPERALELGIGNILSACDRPGAPLSA